MHIHSKLAAALLACAIMSAPALAADKTAKGSAVATVNGVPIQQSAFDAMFQEQRAQGRPETDEMKKAIRDELIRREILAQEAKKNGLAKNPTVVAQMELARQAVLVRSFIQDYLKNNPVSEAQLQAEYDLLKTKMGGTEYKSRHILVETEDTAKEIIQKLKKGEKFADLAQQSKDPGSKENGGDLGWSAAGAFVPPFAEALTKLEKGKFTEAPVKTDFGWHVILLEESRPVSPPPFDAVKPQLAQRSTQQLIEKLIEGLQAKAKVQ